VRRLALTALSAAAVLVPAGAARADYVIDGRGFGHGVGMSQYGAYGYAQREGRDFRWILGHYYPGTNVGRVASARVRVVLRDTRTPKLCGATRARAAGGRSLRLRDTRTYAFSAYGAGKVRVVDTTSKRTRAKLTAPVRVSGGASTCVRGEAINGVRNGSYRGTMRTPNEVGYSETDTRHNLSFAGSTTLPWRIQFSAIVKAISGSPIPVSAGFDIDGDSQLQNDRPAGLGITVGRNNVAHDLEIINALRASRNLPAITPDLIELRPFYNIDLRLTKVLQLGGARHLELFLEGFNATNFLTLNNGIGTITNRTAFTPTTARAARQLQLGARYAF